jgi:hypothetical protein
MEDKKGWRMRNKVLLIATLLLSGVVSGSVFLYVVNANGTKDILVLNWVNGKIILDAEDREELTQEIISITLEDDQVKALIAGKEFMTHVTIVKSVQEMEETFNESGRRIHIEFDYVAIVTLAFDDGSGYNIPVNWEEWTIGEPEYFDQVAPPPSTRIAPTGERTVP